MDHTAIIEQIKKELSDELDEVIIKYHSDVDTYEFTLTKDWLVSRTVRHSRTVELTYDVLPAYLIKWVNDTLTQIEETRKLLAQSVERKQIRKN